MAGESDEDRIRRKAHELWEAEGRPHGRDSDHWTQAREIIAIEDSEKDTLLPRDYGSGETIEEPDEALRNLADFPNLTDQGENLLTSTDREPGGMASVEVPISDQPGVPAKRSRAGGGAAKKPATPKSSSKPAQPVSAAPEAVKAKTASVPKAAKPEPAKPAAAKPEPVKATTAKPAAAPSKARSPKKG
jgi:hypothetical protein